MTTRKKSAADIFAQAVESVGDSFNGSVTRPTSTGGIRTTGGISAVSPPSVFGKGGAADPAGQYWVELLNALGKRFGIGQSDLVDFLSGIGLPTGHDISDAQLTDLNKQFVDSLLSAASEQDARNYNQQMLADQRLYDNPQNQLARLMGAGISRDAAIQMLSGAGGSGAGGVVIGQAATMPAGIAATQSDLNKIQGSTSIANTVFGGINAISGLVSLGFSIPQAIAQTSALQIGNAMSQKALIGLQSADAVLGALQNAVSIGAISTQDMDGFSNATDALNYMYDHQDTNAFKSVFKDGSFAQVYGTKLGRDMFAQAWDSVRQSKDGGTMLDNYIKQNIARTKLAGLDIEKSYQELQYAIGELSRQDVEIQRLWNDVWEGNIRLEIAGEELKVKKFEGNQADTYNKVFDKVYNTKYGEGSPDTRELGTGSSLLAFDMWSNLAMQFYKAFAQNGTKERRDAWERFFLNNNESAQLLAGLQLSMSRIQSSAANPELNPLTSTLISIWTLAKMTGAYDVMKIGVDAATDAFPYVLTPNAPK